ncbi:protein NLRC3-like [Myxocyprinus asiaticus]|uniref:protein NLRC3-like n=1 Tax=Myxocyprinus asiaticus TaxID=70543 RepID=UPI0022216BB6|nr:protein NLRC3-like [Myxocyprinus asiaticus]
MSAPERKKTEERSTRSGTEEILTLARLAWHMLEKDTLIFTEKDMKMANIDGLLPVKLVEDWPMIFNTEELMHLGKTFRFTHPSIQELLAALYVTVNLLSFILIERVKRMLRPTEVPLEMHRRALDRASRSKNGHLDIFLLFLLGMSFGSSKILLSDFFRNSSCNVRLEDLVLNILRKIQKSPSFGFSVNLSRCLEELDVALPIFKDRGQIEFQGYANATVKPSECSHVATTLVTSVNSSATFYIKKHANTEEAAMKLVPAIEISRVLSIVFLGYHLLIMLSVVGLFLWSLHF